MNPLERTMYADEPTRASCIVIDCLPVTRMRNQLMKAAN
jgi:hypothetical protein